jgi:hypothetical protein
MEDEDMTALAPTRPASSALTARRLGTLAAIVAGPIFLAVTMVITLLELDYMHGLGWSFTGDDDVPWPSGLALGSYGPVQIVNFALAGLLLFAFVRVFRPELGLRRSGRIAGGLLAAFAVAFAALAFPTDHATAAGQDPNTWHGYLHVAAFVAFNLMGLAAPIAVAIALRRNERWRRFPALSLGVAALSVAFFFLPLGDPGFVAHLVVLFGWFAGLALRFRRVSDLSFAAHQL